MAFVWQHPKSKYWIARFFDLHGKRRNRSTKTTNRKTAEKLANEFEAAAQKKRTARQMRAVISDLYREITGEDLATMSFRQCAAQWLVAKKPETSPATFKTYSTAVSSFEEWLGEKADREISCLTRQELTAFRNHLAGELAPGTVNLRMKCLRMVFKAAKRDRFLDENPAEFVEAIRRESKTGRRPFTIEEVRAVLEACDDEWKSMVMFGLYSGQRLADIASLTWANIDLSRGVMRLITRKTGKSLILPLAPPLLSHLEQLPSSDDPAGPLHRRAFETISKQNRSGTLSNQFADILAGAGLRPKVTHRKNVGDRRQHALSFHSLRATATTLLHEAGVPAAVAQALIGHDSEEIHRLYTKVGSEALRDAASKLPTL